VIRIRTHNQLHDVAQALGVNADWHELENQDVSIRIRGNTFDNTGCWPIGKWLHPGNPALEYYIELRRHDETVAAVNLADLFAMATGQSSCRQCGR